MPAEVFEINSSLRNCLQKLLSVSIHDLRDIILSIYLSILLSRFHLIFSSIYPSIYLILIHPSRFTCHITFLCICISIYLSMYLYFYLSIYLNLIISQGIFVSVSFNLLQGKLTLFDRNIFYT